MRLQADFRYVTRSVSEVESQFLTSLLKKPIENAKRLEFDNKNTLAYRLNTDEKQHLVKIIHEVDQQQTIDGIELQNQAYENGVATVFSVIKTNLTPPLIAGFSLPNSVSAVITPFLDHSYFKKGYEPQLAIETVKLHRFLENHEQKNIWTLNTNKRLDKLSETLTKIRSGQMNLPIPRKDIDFIFNYENLDFCCLNEIRSPLHGDLNYTNVLLSGSKVLFVDFEDVYHSVLPPRFELAYLIERLFFVNSESSKEAFKRSQTFLQEYINNSSSPERFKNIDWLNTVLSINLRSLCVLGFIQSSNITIPIEEFEKFVFLFNKALQEKQFWENLS